MLLSNQSLSRKLFICALSSLDVTEKKMLNAIKQYKHKCSYFIYFW